MKHRYIFDSPEPIQHHQSFFEDPDQFYKKGYFDQLKDKIGLNNDDSFVMKNWRNANR